jgi:hypothetical protein
LISIQIFLREGLRVAKIAQIIKLRKEAFCNPGQKGGPRGRKVWKIRRLQAQGEIAA